MKNNPELLQWRGRERAPHLDSVLDFASVVSDDEGGLHDGRELDVAVSFMLTLELVQQGLIGGLGETEGNGGFYQHWNLKSKTPRLNCFSLAKVSLGTYFTALFVCNPFTFALLWLITDYARLLRKCARSSMNNFFSNLSGTETPSQSQRLVDATAMLTYFLLSFGFYLHFIGIFTRSPRIEWTAASTNPRGMLHIILKLSSHHLGKQLWLKYARRGLKAWCCYCRNEP